MAEHFNTAGTVTMRYAVADHLGSVSSVADEAAAVTERLSYDAWGKRRNAGGTDNTACSITSAISRGFTGHEMMDAVCLINANARIYDPTLGRFMSADSIVPNAFNGQAFNRYAYVLNNPMRYIDPTGHMGEAGLAAGGTGCNVICSTGGLVAWMQGNLPNGGFGGGPYGPHGSEGPNGSAGGGWGIGPPVISTGSLFGEIPDLYAPVCGGAIAFGCWTPAPQGSYYDEQSNLVVWSAHPQWVPGPTFTGVSSFGGTNGEGGTISFTLFGGGQLGPVRIPTGAYGFAFDRHGNFAAIKQLGGGSTLGPYKPTASIGLNVSWSDAKSVSDLSGYFADQNLSGGEGAVFGVNSFEGNSADGKVVGGGVSLGFGGGSSVSLDLGMSYTWVDVQGDNGGGGW